MTETALSSVSSEMLRQLEVLMVEGDLLSVDVHELDALHSVLAACDYDRYELTVLQFEVRLSDTVVCNLATQAHSA